MDVKILKNRIKSRGLKQTWIAEQIGVHKGTLNRFLTGHTVMEPTKVKELLDLLGLEMKFVDKRVS